MKKLVLTLAAFALLGFSVGCSDDGNGSDDNSSTLETGTVTENGLSGTWSTSDGGSLAEGDVTINFLSESKLDFYYTNTSGETAVLETDYTVSKNTAGNASDGFNDTLKLLDASTSRAETYAFIYVFKVESGSTVSFKLIQNNGADVEEVAVTLTPFSADSIATVDEAAVTLPISIPDNTSTEIIALINDWITIQFDANYTYDNVIMSSKKTNLTNISETITNPNMKSMKIVPTTLLNIGEFNSISVTYTSNHPMAFFATGALGAWGFRSLEDLPASSVKKTVTFSASDMGDLSWGGNPNTPLSSAREIHFEFENLSAPTQINVSIESIVIHR